MRVLSQSPPIQRIRSGFLACNSLTHVVSILLIFIPLRIFGSLRDGIVAEGDGVVVAGVELGRVWVGELSFGQVLSAGGLAAEFIRERTTQLLYPLLISLQGPIGWSVETHILVLNTILGASLIAGSYYLALRLGDKAYAFLVALLMCSLTPLYWIARFGIPDNLFYAMIPLFGLSVVNWYQKKTRKSLIIMIIGVIGFAMTRPEAILVILAVTLVSAGNFLRRYLSLRFLLAGACLSLAMMCGAVIAVLNSIPVETMLVTFKDGPATVPSLKATASINLSDFDPTIHVRVQKRPPGSSSFYWDLLSRGHISWGLAMSSQTLLNKGGAEFDRLQFHYSRLVGDASFEGLSTDELAYVMSSEAIPVIQSNPLWYVMKIPIRGLALLFPWTYQPWSLPHVLYEAAYTIFLSIGLILLIRRGGFQVQQLVLLAIPFTIWLFLSSYGIDNDLKHRNGIFVGLNQIAPLGFFLAPRSRRINPEIDSHR